MQNRATKLSYAILFLAGAAASVAPPHSAQAADECIAAPKGPPPQGGHWYYRIDHTTKQHCWYVRSENQGSADAALPVKKSAAPIKRTVEPPANISLSESVAGARAEIPAPAPIWPKVAAAAPALPPTTAANENIPGYQPPPDGQRVTDRLSDVADADSSADVTPTNDIGTNQTPPVVANRSKNETGKSSLWMLVSALAGALLVAGIATSVVVNFNRKKPVTPDNSHGRRRINWETSSGEEMYASAPPRDEIPSWIRIARQAQEVNQRSGQIEQMLSRAQRRTAV